MADETHVNRAILLLMIVGLCASSQQSDSASRRIARSIDDVKAEASPAKSGGKVADKLAAAKSGRASVFATENSTVVWAQIGGTASLPCAVKKNSGTVLWLRERPSAATAATPTILSVGVHTHTADERYYVEHVRHLQNWGLVIKRVRPDDSGVYRCQVSTHPPTIILLHLKVTKAYAEIPGAPDLHLRAGSALRLACEIRLATEPPEYVFWYREDRMINYDAGVRALAGPTSHVLVVADADQSHDGNYTCEPSNAVPAHVNVHVLNATEEENPAAMLHANAAAAAAGAVATNLLAAVVVAAAVRAARQD